MLYLNSRAAASHLFHCAKRWQHSSAGQTLNSVTPDDIAHFTQFLPPNAILSTLSPISMPSSEIEQYNADWMGKYRGGSTTVLRPQTTEQVSKIMRRCHERRIGVVPQGGNTGLVGGSVPLKDELILSLSNMSKVRSFDPVSGASPREHRALFGPWLNVRTNLLSCDLGALVADAGCILEALSEHIAPHEHIMPLDLGAKGRYAQTHSFVVPCGFLSQSQLSDWWKRIHKRGWTSAPTLWVLAWKRAWPRSCVTGWDCLG